jgi:hypothetical protein
MDDLMAALPRVLSAPKSGSAVELLCFRPGYGERRFVDDLTLTRDQGIHGERWGTAPWLKLEDGTGHPGIQVSILPRRVLDLVWRDREATVHPGDTFVADLDMTEANLPEGQLLSVGTAVLRVSEVFNYSCAKWKVRYGAEAYDWVRLPEHRPLRLRGVLCSIEADGVIRNGDRVEVLRP